MDIQEENERQRFVLSAGLFAGSIAVFAYVPSTLNFFIYLRFGLAGIFLFSFAYLFISAAHLKYNVPGRVPEMYVSHKFREFCYDWSINLFGLMIPLVISYATVYLLGWTGEHEYWGAAIVTLCFLIVVLLLRPIYSIARRVYRKFKR